MANVYDFEAQTIDGHTVALSDYQGKVLLIVNTASACGFTPSLQDWRNCTKNLPAKAWWCWAFPATSLAAKTLAATKKLGLLPKNYGVSFPMMAKTEVNGAQAHPLYQWLKGQAPGVLGSEGIKWNFTKFLVAKDGTTVKRYGSMDTPASVSKDIAAALAI